MGKIEVVCDRCGKKFLKWKYRLRKHNYCSKECVKNRIKYYCKGCGKELYDNPSNLKYRSGKSYCSLECKKKHTNSVITCETCGKKFTVWKSRSWIRHCSRKCQGYSLRKHPIIEYNGVKYYKTTAGYYVSRPKGKHGVMLHRKVYEDFYKTKLKENQTLHHINGVKADNRVENLELWESRHPKGQRVEDIKDKGARYG